MSKIVADTSIIINGQLLSNVQSGHLNGYKVIIPQVVLDELQSQATLQQKHGFAGLDEIKKLQDLSDQFDLLITVEGNHPTSDDINLASRGRLDALIKDIAKQNNATLYTSDKTQHLVALAEGIKSILVMSDLPDEKPEFLKYFDSNTMSVHLKENLPPMAKRGKPGSFVLEDLEDKPLTAQYLESLYSQILDAANVSSSVMVEMSKPGASVVQHGTYRIAMTRPPLSEGFEITIVHPIVNLSIEDYDIPEELLARFSDTAKGVLISGPPGSGKSTLASGLANFYHKMGNIVKTFESPRDLQVDSGITQYTKLSGSFNNTAEILLLVRPDYTIFDEVRRREDFETFSDLRLAGVGMVGVVHASSPLDAIQRFIGKIELGMIPNVLDTVVFVKDGRVGNVYSLALVVKVPTGMTESDLARPVIEIRDFENNTLKYEIYTFGEENVIMPIPKHARKAGIARLAEEKICETFKRYDLRAEVDVISESRAKVTVDERYIPSIIGRGGSNIGEIEKSLGLHIQVVARDSDVESPSDYIQFTFSESKSALLLTVGREYASIHTYIYAGDRYVTSARVSRGGTIKIPKRSEAARDLLHYASSQKDIRVSLKDS